MKSLFTILLLGLFLSSEAQNISQSQVRQFNAVPAYRVFGRGAGVGTPSFITLDSNHVPQLHSQSYYDLRYGSLSIQNTNTSNISANTTSIANKWDINGNVLIPGVNFIGSTNNVSLHFKTNNAESAVLDSLGRFGLGDFGSGSRTPETHLHIVDNETLAGSAVTRGVLVEQNTNNQHGATYLARKSRGSYSSPLSVVNGDYIGGFGYYPRSSTGYLGAVEIGARVNGAVTSTSIPTDLYIATSPTGIGEAYLNNAVKFTLQSDGKVGIGNNLYPTQRLHVGGKVRIDTLPTGLSSDSVVTVNNGVLGKIAQSSISGGTTTGGTTDTTSISQRINRKPRVFNVEDYGAVHDGVMNDQPAIQAAINACDAAGGGTVYFPNGTYILSGLLQTSVSGTNPNSQLYIPSHAIGSSLRQSITLLGESAHTASSGYSSLLLPLPTTGTILISTITGSGNSPSVIGTIGTTGNYQNYNYTDIYLKGLAIRTYTNNGASAPTLSAVNMFYAAKISMENVTISTDIISENTPNPVNNEVAGVVFSGINNDGPNTIKDCAVQGYKYGFILGEHTILHNAYSFCNYYGFVFPKIYNTVNGKALVHANVYGIYFPTTSVMGIPSGSSYVNLDVESEIDSAGVFSSYWYQSKKNVVDSSNYGTGILRFKNTSGDGTGANLNASISLYNGANLNIQDYEGKYRSNQNFLGGITGMLTGNITGGSATTSSITYKTTTGAGTTGADHIFQVGNNGATEAMRILNNGNVGIGTNNASQLLHIKSTANTNVIGLLEATSAGVSAQSAFRVQNDLGTIAQMSLYSSTHAAYGAVTANMPYFYSSSTAGMAVVSDANAPIIFAAGTGAIERMRITGTGGITFPSTNTAAGTTGAQTINKPTGSVNFAAGATTLVVTNSLVSATSYVQVQVYGNDATAKTATVTRAAGSFTITLNAAATSEVAVGFIVHN